MSFWYQLADICFPPPWLVRRDAPTTLSVQVTVRMQVVAAGASLPLRVCLAALRPPRAGLPTRPTGCLSGKVPLAAGTPPRREGRRPQPTVVRQRMTRPHQRGQGPR